MDDTVMREAGPIDTGDNTIISNYVKCHRKLYWFLRRYVRERTPSYFTFGRGFGQGINKYHEMQGKNFSWDERRLAAAKEAAQIWHKEDPFIRPGDKSNTLENMLLLLKLYCETYQDDEDWIVIASETGFRLPIPGSPFYYAGSLDCYIQWPNLGLLLREDKTVGDYITDNYLAQWTHASQVTGYIWALGSVIGEEPYGCLMNIASKRNRKVPSDRFARQLETRTEWKISRFMEETVKIMEQIANEWEDWCWAKTGERDPISCAGGMGRGPCEYRSLCLLDMDPWNFPPSYSFSVAGLEETIRPWAPWEREGTDD